MVITNTAAYALSQREEGAWGTAKVDEAIGFGAQATTGKFAATAVRRARDGEVYISFVTYWSRS